MFEQMSLPLLWLIFAAAAAIVWIAGVHVSKTTDVLSTRFGLGEALAGVVLLAIVTNLPEIAITASGALRNQLGIATGNILGGIAIQTVVLVLLDAFGLGKKAPLSSHAASLDLLLEGVLVIAVLTIVVMGHQLPEQLIWRGITPDDVLIFAVWITGIYLIGKARGTGLPWQSHGDAPGGQRHRTLLQKRERADAKKSSTMWTLIVFIIAAAATLIAGVVL